MPLGEHLEELRRRLLVALAAFVAATGAVWAWSGELLALLARPVGGLVFIQPAEAFFTRLKVAAFGGLLLALPVVLDQAWRFAACALEPATRRAVALLFPLSYLLFLAGCALSLAFVVPAAMRFLIACGSSSVTPLLAVGPYVDFAAGLSLAFGLVFQLPLVLVGLERAGIVDKEDLRAQRRPAYLGCVAAAALLTPGPDVVSQLALALPMALLFEVALFFMGRRA